MNIILRLICGFLGEKLWCLKHGVYEAASFAGSVTSWCLQNDMQNFAFVILKMNNICIAQ